MYIKNIKLKNFRNYTNQEIELNKNINIFFGDNAQGKTNIIESIYISSIGKSLRTSGYRNVGDAISTMDPTRNIYRRRYNGSRRI